MDDTKPRFYVDTKGERFVVIDRESHLIVAGPVEQSVAERIAEEKTRHAAFKREFGLKQDRTDPPRQADGGSDRRSH